MKEETLRGLGLSQNETRVYLALLETGLASVTKVSQVSKIHRVNIYDAIEKLKQKGLVSEIIKNNKKQFQPANPESLKHLLNTQDIKLQAIMPQLQMNYSMLQETKKDVKIYDGPSAIRNIYLEYLKTKKPIVAFGVPKDSTHQFGTFFQDEIHKRRADQKQWMYHIYNEDALDRAKLASGLPFTKARILKHGSNSPVTTRVCDDQISITFYYDTPLTIVIKNKDMADSYLHYFWILWKQAKEV